MTDLLIPPKRRRGSQPGNLNALKHGFYASRFKPKDLTGVEATDNNSLLDEIRILRLYTRRLIELDAQPDDLDHVANILKLLCLSALTINRLVKTSQFLQANSKNSSSELHRAIEYLTSIYKLDQLDMPDLDLPELSRLTSP